MSSDPSAVSEVASDPAVTPDKATEWYWPLPTAVVPIDHALAVATADAQRVYGGNLGRFRVEITLEDDGWHIAHLIQQRNGSRIAGGGPHYVIDATTGAIVSKKYYQ